MANKECQIFFSFDNNYVQTAKVALYSLLNKINKYIKLDLFILHNNITYGNQLKLLKITSLFKNANLHFIKANNLMHDIFSSGRFSHDFCGSHFTHETLLRCFASSFFPQYDRIVYSDVDIVVMDDISELFNFDIKDVYVAGVKNPFMKWNEFELSHLSKQNYDKLKDSYIAGGILIMNLKKIREDNIEKKMIKVIIDNTIEKRWNDQDVINIACEGCVKFLPLNYISYPYLIDLITKKDFLSHYSNKELFDSIINPKIIHYASEKPWNGNPRLSQFWWQIYEYLKLVV